MTTVTPEQRELQLVESVEFRILTVANDEDKLTDLLGRYLAPIILKAQSPNAAVRNKVITLLSRLRTFIQPPSVILPVKALLEQYKSTDSAIIKQLDLPLIQHSLGRLDEDDRRDLIPIALKGCSKDEGQPRAASFFNIILQLLIDVRIPSRGSKEDETLRASIGLEDPADAKYLAKMLSLFLRLRPPTPSRTVAESNPTFSEDESKVFSVEGSGTDKIFQNISQVKAKAVSFLASAAFTDEEKFLPALYASSTPDTRVASMAEEIIKRTSVSLEQEDLVKKLFEAHSRLPAAYRTRILNLLSKSTIASTMSQSIMNVVNLDFLPSFTQDSSTDALKPSSTLEKTKLHKALFQFLSWVAQVGPTNKDFSIGPNLIKSMQSYIESQGWPVPVQQITHDEVQLRSRGYETIGMLARSADMPFKERIALAAWLFQSLSEDPTNEAVVNIDGALSSLTANVPEHIADEDLELRNMLLKYMSLSEKAPAVRSTRHAVVKWANECLSFTNIDARWINFMAVAGRHQERSDVIEQGQKGLDPWTYAAHREVAPVMPDWRLMVFKYFKTAPDLAPPADYEPGPGVTALPNDNIFDNFRGSNINAFALIIQYCKNMIFLAALPEFEVQPDWMQTLSAQIKTNIKTREKIQEYLRYVDPSYLSIYLNACLVGAFLEDAPITEECLRCFVDIASLSPRVIVGEFTKHRVTNLLPLIKSNKSEIRDLSARALGILAAHPTMDVDDVQNWGMTLNALFEKATTAVGPDLNAAEGALAAYGHLCSRSVLYNHASVAEWKYPLQILIEENVPGSLFDAAVEAFTHLWLAKLAIPPKDGATSLDKIIKRLSKKAKKGNEKAIIGLGMLAASIPDAELPESPASWSEGPVGTILTELFALHETKRVEIHFTVGEAITIAIARWDSDYVKLMVDVEYRTRDFQNKRRESLLTSILDKLFEDCKATKPSLLKASGIWLFCILQYCSDLHEVNSRLRQAQAAFMRLLPSRDELVQETASRGLSLVHERGDEQLRAALVKDLIAAFTGSAQLKVDGDTELFEPGALPTGEGSSISSYKDIVSLANEVGDQGLVYKFMALAANATEWSTRSAFGRFGLTNILSDAEVDPKIYPKLYRYRFDPNTNVQRSMSEIWKALVKDPKTVMDVHFDAIMEELLKSILGREWRMREASCAAISELLTGVPFERYEKFYSDIWAKAVKVFDDVKGSVREAAFRLCRSLSNTLARQLEEGTHEASANAMMQKALPFLLSDKAAESSVQEVQVFAIITLIKIARHGGKHLKPFIPEVIPKLLGLLSTIEPDRINYYYQQVGEDSREKIDKIRSQMVNQSPISEAIDNILRFVDEDVMVELAPRLEATIKTAIGMPTKIGCSRVLTTLFTRHTNEIKSVSTQFLELLGKQVLDKNDEVSQAYARASAYIMRVVSDSAKQRFSERMLNLYLQSEDEVRRQKVSDVIVSLAKISPDHFTTQETILLPFAYLGSHDVDDYTSKVFREVWDQHSGSNRTVVRYVPEIVSLVERCLATTQWSLRHTGAFTVAAMVTDVASASDTTGAISEANLKAIWPVFEKALALKTFPGKEKLLEAFPEFIEKGQFLWRYNADIAALMKKIVLREAKRNNDDYRVHAFRCLWRFAKAVDSVDLLQDIVDIVSPHLEDLKDDNKMDVDSKEETVIKTAKNGLEAVARGYSRLSDRRAYVVASQVIKALEPYLFSPKFNAIKREVWYESVIDLMKDLAASEPPADSTSLDKDGVLQGYLGSLDVDKAEVGVESQRLKRVEAVSATLKAYTSGVFGKSSVQMDEFEAAVVKAKEEERVPEVQRGWQRVLTELQEARG